MKPIKIGSWNGKFTSTKPPLTNRSHNIVNLLFKVDILCIQETHYLHLELPTLQHSFEKLGHICIGHGLTNKKKHGLVVIMKKRFQNNVIIVSRKNSTYKGRAICILINLELHPTTIVCAIPVPPQTKNHWKLNKKSKNELQEHV
ncbi:hypothetical protein AKO1_003329 [Acrasis kona]|uniref:Endonuclease/exonuclease/phosphatase domain-containing protein n=1 Tax=Acrasis kona TaxID=1008807 RepID=A0AAW2Z8J3_9EUKA